MNKFIYDVRCIVSDIIDRLPIISGIRREWDCSHIPDIFVNKDFQLTTTTCNGYKKYLLSFTDKFGYKIDGYSPSFYFDVKNKCWVVELDQKQAFSCKGNPCFMLIDELRGYNLLENIQANDVVIDVGASDGLTALFFSKLVGPAGKVIALEPDRRWHKIFDANIKQNRADNVFLVKKALFNCDGDISIDFSHDMGAAKVSSHKESKTAKAKIDSVTFMNLLIEYKIHSDTVRLVKLDIEGAELDIIDDLVTFVKNNINAVVCVASYHVVDGRQTHVIIEEKYKNLPEVLVKTVYPYHTTTYIVNAESEVANRLTCLPSYEAMNAIIWPNEAG